VKIQETSKTTKVALLIVAIVLFNQNNKQAIGSRTRESIAALPAPSSQPTTPKYTDEEMHRFWDLHMNELVMVELVGGKYPIPEINERYKTLVDETVRRYGRIFNIEASTKFNEYDKHAIAGCEMNGEIPIARIFVPGVMDVYAELRTSGDALWEKKFENLVVTTLLHEVDHIAAGRVGNYVQSKKALIDAETETWAKTCEYTVSIFVKRGLPVSGSDAWLYNGWVTCGKQNNSCWRAIVGNLYETISKHYK
jgi:hypothetical protein